MRGRLNLPMFSGRVRPSREQTVKNGRSEEDAFEEKAGSPECSLGKARLPPKIVLKSELLSKKAIAHEQKGEE